MIKKSLLHTVVVLLSGIAWAQPPIYRPGTIYRPVHGVHAAIVGAEPYATEAAFAVLKAGGNAIDASVTMGFCLAVTLPRAGNIGGGGFLVYHDASTSASHALDYRETAPMNAHRDMFLDDQGKADAELSRYSTKAIGTPGTVAGLLSAHQRFGTLPLKDLMAPAIRMAEEGVPVHPALLEQLQLIAASDRISEIARETYLRQFDETPQIGEVFRQPKLAATLKRIARKGKAGFYEGPVAQDIVKTIQARGDGISMEDLATYKPVWRAPVLGTFRGHQVISMPPPSSGGVHLVQMLNLLEHFDLRESGHNSARSTYLLTEVMKRAYADRSKFLGDPDYTDIPVAAILSDAYAARILEGISVDPLVPVPSEHIHPGDLSAIPSESPETTHFSIVDSYGNAVSNTYTLNFSFGSGIMTRETGILLNNEMDDFSAKAGVPNAYGLIGGEANAVAPGKRPLSSMTPTIVLKDGRVYAVTGSPGGSRIINTVLQVVVNLVEFDMNAAEANYSPRIHHQWLPDVLQLEKGFPFDSRNLLEQLGYQIEMDLTIGSASTIARDQGGSLTAAADPRRTGSTALAY